MSKAPSFQFYPTDIGPDLDPLTMIERGVYLTMMRQLWSYGGPMPIDEADALLQKPWLSLGLILRRRFAESNGCISLEWMEIQREKQAIFRELQASKGKKGGRPRKGKKPSLSSGLTKRKPNISPRNGDGVGIGDGIGNGKVEPENAEMMPWPTFDDFWTAYERKGNRKATELEWAKIDQKEREAIMDHVPYYNSSKPDKQFRKDGERYLKGRVWEDEIVIPTNIAAKSQTKNLSNDEYAQSVAEALQRKFARDAAERGRDQ